MSNRMPLVRIGLLSVFGVAGFAGALATIGSIAACESLSETTVVPDGAPVEYDAGALPELEDASGGSATPPPSGTPPESGRIRLANLLEGGPSIDVCARLEQPATAPWIENLVENSPAAKAGGLKSGEVSAHKFLSAGPGAGTRYVFRIIPAGGSCDSAANAIANVPATALRQGAGLTVVAFGVATGADAGDANPRATAIADEVNPAANVARVRTFHGIPDLPPFDFVVNGETVAQGVKYGGAASFPYSSTSGFVSLAAGIPESSKMTLRAGTSVRSFNVPERVRRGVAVTFFASGRAAAPVVSLCSDRSPSEGAVVADCQRLNEVQD